MEMRVMKADPLGVEHLSRFRRIGGDIYPSRVAEVYGRDLAAAAADTDEQVAAKVGVGKSLIGSIYRLGRSWRKYA